MAGHDDGDGLGRGFVGEVGPAHLSGGCRSGCLYSTDLLAAGYTYGLAVTDDPRQLAQRALALGDDHPSGSCGESKIFIGWGLKASPK